jgi:SAM-dependent methyltransferase
MTSPSRAATPSGVADDHDALSGGALTPDPETRAALARLYDLDLADDPGDLDLYLALAERIGGPILELAVGSGRLAVPLAAAGFAVTGVDLDPAMLDRARAAAAAPGQGRARKGRRLELVEADLVGLTLPSAGTFRLAFIALNSLLLLASRAAQREAFRALARHLAPGGLAVVDVWQPGADDLARYDGRIILEHARRDPETGRLVTKASSAQHDPSSQLVTLTTIYEEGAQGGAPVRWLRVDRLRLVSADELVGFAEDAGLEVEELAGDYDLAPIGPSTDRAILVAVRP